MYNGFMFENNNKFYFIPCNYEKKNKTVASGFINYFVSICKFTPPLEMVENTYKTIYKNMYKASVKRSEDFTQYFIHTKYSGLIINENDLIFIEI